MKLRLPFCFYERRNIGCFEGTEGEAPCASECESQRTDISDIIALHRRSHLKADARLGPTHEFTLDQTSILQFQRICTGSNHCHTRAKSAPQICLLFITSSPACSFVLACCSICRSSDGMSEPEFYLPRPGGKSFSSFCAPLLSLSWFFSGFLLGSIACWAPPIQTSFFTAGSYIPTTKVPM